MEQTVRRVQQTNERQDRELADRERQLGNDLSRVFSLRQAPDAQAGTSPAPTRDKPAVDWSASLEVIRQTAKAMRASADRVQKIEARAQAVAERAVKELQNAQTRIDALEARLSAAEAREKGSALRAEEAENWLRRLHDAITQELPESLGLLESISHPASG